MNVLELEIQEIKDVYKHVLIALRIDNQEFLATIDKNLNAVVFEGLLASINQSGEYLIFTCSCGIADCGGWKKVKVIHIDNLVKWYFIYNKIEYRFEFAKDFYVGEIQRIKFDLDLLGKDIVIEPEFIVEPG